MAKSERAPATPAEKAKAVEVFSVKPGNPQFVRFLGDLLGLNTHWNGKRSVPCDGEPDCPQGLHRSRTIYKAYAPGERWDDQAKMWFPVVIEATESLEEQLRGRPLRGEVWRLSRAKEGRKDDPIAAIYCETIAGDKLREAFNIEPVLLRFYHVRKLVLGANNLLPEKLLLPASSGDQPKLPFTVEPTEPPVATREQIARLEQVKMSVAERAKARLLADQASTKNHEENGKVETNGQKR